MALYGELEQGEQGERRRTQVAAEHKRLHLQLAQPEAAARLQVIQTEMKARSAEIAVLADATGSASTLLRSDKAMLRKLRHADEDLRVAGRPDGAKSGSAKGKLHKVAL